MKNTIEKHNSPGLFGLFGLPFLLAGLFFLYQVFNPDANWANDERPFFIVIPLCSVFIILGLFILAGRSGFIIDPLAKRASTYFGLIIPLYYKRINLSQIEHIHLKKELRRNKNSSYYTYVTLLVPHKGKSINIDSEVNYLLAREKVERIARECQIGLKNDVQGNKVTPHTEVDKSFCDKVKGVKIELPKAPTHSKITTSNKMDNFVIINSHGDSLTAKLIPVVLSALFILPMFFIFFNFFEKAPSAISLIAGAMFIVPLLAMLGKKLKEYTTRLEITVNKNMVKVEKQGMINESYTIDIKSIDDIDGLEIGEVKEDKSTEHSEGKKTLISLFGALKLKIVTQNKVFAFGPFANPEDLNYTRNLIAYAVNRNS